MDISLGISDVKEVNGILKFSNKEHLLNVTKEIGQLEDMTKWYQGKGFNSLLEKQNKINNSEVEKIAETGILGKFDDVYMFKIDEYGENELVKIIDDPRLAAVLNENNFVIVDKEIYHVDKRIISYNKINNTKDIIDFIENPKMSGVSYDNIETTRYEPNGRTKEVMGETIIPINDNRRYKAGFYRHHSVLYQSLVIKMVYQKKNWIGWSGTESQYMEFEALGHYQLGWVYPIPTYAHLSGYNIKELNFFVDEYYGTPDISLNWLDTNGLGHLEKAWDLQIFIVLNLIKLFYTSKRII